MGCHHIERVLVSLVNGETAKVRCVTHVSGTYKVNLVDEMGFESTSFWKQRSFEAQLGLPSNDFQSPFNRYAREQSPDTCMSSGVAPEDRWSLIRQSEIPRA